MKNAIIGKKLKAMLLLLPCIVILLGGGLFFWNQFMLSRDAQYLQASGYQYAMADSDYALSYLKIGNDAAKHIVVTISDIGVDDFAEQLDPMIACLKDNALFICMNRAGYGLSGDTDKAQTIDKVVADYRIALENANIEPPYVLLPHAYGGVIATYWESQYPDEIAGVFYLDGAVLSEQAVESQYSPVSVWMQRLSTIFGFTRFNPSIVGTLPPDYAPAQKANAARLSIRSHQTTAKSSEAKLLSENYSTAYTHIVANDIPKAYLNAASFRTREDWLASDDWARTFQQIPEIPEAERLQIADQEIEACRNATENTVKPYIELLGNCEYMELPGNHFIHMQKPTSCAVLFSQFLTRIEYTISTES